MDVLKSYAHQVVSYHPEKERDELFAEIYDELCEEFADWQSQHPEASPSDFLDTCKEHPMKYATRLASEGSAYLVGPQFYFSFISALKTGAVITAAFYLVIAVLSALSTGHYLTSFWRVLTDIPLTLMWVSAAILGVFIALEKGGEGATWLDGWSSKDLVPMSSHQQISRGETFFDLAVSLLGLLWLANIIQIPAMIRHDGDWITEWTIHLPSWFWIAAGIMLTFDAAYAIWRLMRPIWSRRLRLTTITSNLLWIGLLTYAIVQPQLLTTASQMPEELFGLVPVINKALLGVLAVVLAILVWDTAWHGWRLLRDARLHGRLRAQ